MTLMRQRASEPSSRLEFSNRSASTSFARVPKANVQQDVVAEFELLPFRQKIIRKRGLSTDLNV